MSNWATASRLFQVALAVALAASCDFAAAQKASDSTQRTIEQFFAHPLFNESYTCSEHAAGELAYLGDDLGQDCIVEQFVKDGDRMFAQMYAKNGYENEDWFGWDKVVLSPCDCTVEAVKINPVTNTPGITGKPPASIIRLKTSDGIFVMLAHIQKPVVKEGDVLKSGQPVARVGNNGFARAPHIHIGAWRGNDALQIRWDQKHIAIH